MLLSLLKEENKKIFLELCIYASNANGVFEASERDMILEYCNEMKIVQFDMKCSKTLEEVFETIKKDCTETEKRIITLELLGLLYADDSFDYDEEGFLNNYVNAVDIQSELLDEIKSLFEDYLDVYKRIFKVVNCD